MKQSRPRVLLDHCLQWLEWFPDDFVFPQWNKVPGICDFHTAGSRNPHQLEYWWQFPHQCKAHPDPWPDDVEWSWGLSRVESNLVFVDVDHNPAKGKFGADTYDELEILFGWPETQEYRQGPDDLNRHMIYTLPGSLFHNGTKNSAHPGIDFAQHIPIPGCDRYGYLYRDVPRAPFPAWAIELTGAMNGARAASPGPHPYSGERPLQRPAVRLDQLCEVERMAEWLQDRGPYGPPKSIQGSHGDAVLLQVCGVLKDHGISLRKSCELIDRYYNLPGVCEPRWSRKEIGQKVRNARRYLLQNEAGEQSLAASVTLFGDAAEYTDPDEKRQEQLRRRAYRTPEWRARQAQERENRLNGISVIGGEAYRVSGGRKKKKAKEAPAPAAGWEDIQ
jgi:hypothetical protein